MMLKTKEEIKKWLEDYEVQNFIINDDLTVDVNSLVDLRNMLLTEIPVQFGIVKDSFWCQQNQLTSLKGAPFDVGETFICSSNKLTTLEYSPQKVGYNFLCSNNLLTSLEGAPEKIESVFDCSNNQLTSLKGAPKNVGSSFSCENNKLTTLEYSPQNIGFHFYCRRNPLQKLGEIDTEIKGEFICNRFEEIEKLKHVKDPNEDFLYVDNKELNNYIQQLKNIMDNKNLLEAATPQAQSSIKNKFKI